MESLKIWGRQLAMLSLFGIIWFRKLRNTLQDLQAAWLLLLYCAAGKPNFLIQTVSPGLTEGCASAHERQMWLCCRKIPHLGEHGTPALAQTIVSLPLRQGGLGLRNTVRLRGAAMILISIDHDCNQCHEIGQGRSGKVKQNLAIFGTG